MVLGMETRFAVEPRLPNVAAKLMAACESGDRLLLAAALRHASSELGDESDASPFASEVRELLLGVVQRLHGLLGAHQAVDLRGEQQWQVCYELLRHARGTAMGVGYVEPLVQTSPTS